LPPAEIDIDEPLLLALPPPLHFFALFFLILGLSFSSKSDKTLPETDECAAGFFVREDMDVLSLSGTRIFFVV